MEQKIMLNKVEAVKNETAQNHAEIDWIKHKLQESSRNFYLDSIGSNKVLSH